MLIPTKLDNLNYNPMILGAYVTRFVRKKEKSFEETFHFLSDKFNIDFELFLDVVIFLWLTDVIYYSNNKIFYGGKNDPEENLY